MPAKRRPTPTKAGGSSNAASPRSGKSGGGAKIPTPSSGTKKKAPPPIVATHSSRENGKGDFLGKGGVLTLGSKASPGGRGRGRGGKSSPGRGGGGGPKGRGAASKARGRPGASGGSDASSDEGESERGEDVEEMEESSEDGEGQQEPVASAKRGKSKKGKGGEVDESEGEESEQELQSFMEAFPGMSSDEDEEGEDGGLGGDGRDSSSGGEESDSDAEEDGGLMDVSFCCMCCVFVTQVSLYVHHPPHELSAFQPFVSQYTCAVRPQLTVRGHAMGSVFSSCGSLIGAAPITHCIDMERDGNIGCWTAAVCRGGGISPHAGSFFFAHASCVCALQANPIFVSATNLKILV